MLAALLRNTTIVLCRVGIISNAEIGAMHLIGKLIFVRSVLPLNSFLPTILTISVPAERKREVRALSVKVKPP